MLDRLFMLPCASYTSTPYFASSVAQPFVSVASLVIIAFRAVPASPPFTPAFAIVIKAAVVSSTEYPIEAAVAAQFLYASPSASVVVFEWLIAYAISSANFPASFADSPNAVK